MEALDFIYDNLQIVITVVLLALFLLIRRVVRRIIRSHAFKNNLGENRVLYTTKFINTILMVVIMVFIAITWDLTFQGLSIYVASIATILGVALFAQWSIISNVTASIILFFQYTYKMGSTIKIVDGDNSIVGKIVDISLFYIKIEMEDGNTVSYPNSLALQRPIIEFKENQ